MAVDIWHGYDDNWDTASDWTNGLPTKKTRVGIFFGDPLITAGIDAFLIWSTTDVTFVDAGSSTVTGNFINKRELLLDAGNTAGGGTNLAIGHLLKNWGAVQIGSRFGGLLADDTLSAGSIDNIGYLYLYGSVGRATLNVAGMAGFGTTGVISGHIELDNNALIDFQGGGQLTTIAQSAFLTINGSNAFLASGTATTSNSALSGLAAEYGDLNLADGAVVKTSGSLTVSGDVEIDFDWAEGGSELVVGGILTNSGQILVGSGQLTADDMLVATGVYNSAFLEIAGNGEHRAEVEISGAAQLSTQAGVLAGNVGLSGNAMIVFEGGGQITTIAGYLSLEGENARVADATDLTSNSALQKLSSITGGLYLSDDTLTISGALNVGDGAFLRLGVGSSMTIAHGLTIAGTLQDSIGVESLAIGGRLTNTGRVDLGEYGSSQYSTTTTCSGITNSGSLSLGTNATLQDNGNFINSGGVIIGVGSALYVTGSSTGSGHIYLEGGALYLGGSGSGDAIGIYDIGRLNSAIFVTGAGAKLANVMTGFSSFDKIEFTDTTYIASDSVVYRPSDLDSGGTVTVETKQSAFVASFQVSGSYTQAEFKLQDFDDHVGVII